MSGIRALSNPHGLLAMLAAGSLWGFFEVAGSAWLRVSVPWARAGALVGLGMLLMGVLLGATRRWGLLPGAALLASAARQLVVPLLDASFLCKANASLAVAIQGLAAGSVVAFLGDRVHERPAIRIAAAPIAALLSAGVFWAVGMHVAPCDYLRSFDRPDGLSAFLLREGLLWALLSCVALPAGYGWGRRLALMVATGRWPAWSYCACATVLSVLAWSASAAATFAGY